MTVTTQGDWATHLIELLDHQRRVYLQLQELSQRQTELVAAGEAESLLDVLSQRQRLIDALTSMNAQLEPYKQNWPALWSQLDVESQSRIKSLIDHVQELLDQIVAQDERDRAALNQQREQVAGSLRQVRQGSAVHRAYGRPAASADNNNYTDEQG